jgi:uroporphyrin-III C-methyltransferase/precorrin-2 dehydrogenase/sirohydrochlorin ferrochelatase
VFARSKEEVDALKAHNIPFEIVPGVTAAFAASASLGESLTERGNIDSLVLATGHLENGYAVPNAVKDMKPGTRVALYMAVGGAADLVAQLNDAHVAASIELHVVAKAQRVGEVKFSCAPNALEQTLNAHDITGEAIIFVRWPHSHVGVGEYQETA